MRGMVCRCCGEEMGPRTGALSRNPNICASCSSLLDAADQEQKTLGSADESEAHGVEAIASAVSASPSLVLTFTA